VGTLIPTTASRRPIDKKMRSLALPMRRTGVLWWRDLVN
jgi:hypothetical protein